MSRPQTFWPVQRSLIFYHHDRRTLAKNDTFAAGNLAILSSLFSRWHFQRWFFYNHFGFTHAHTHTDMSHTSCHNIRDYQRMILHPFPIPYIIGQDVCDMCVCVCMWSQSDDKKNHRRKCQRENSDQRKARLPAAKVSFLASVRRSWW